MLIKNLLKKYSRKSGVLKIREPSLESKNMVDLSTYFAEYEAVVRKTTADIQEAQKSLSEFLSCGDDTDSCCHHYRQSPFGNRSANSAMGRA